MALEPGGAGTSRSTWSIVSGVVLVLVGAPVAIAALAVVIGDSAVKTGAQRVGEAVFVAVAVLPAAAGGWLLWRRVPHLNQRWRRRSGRVGGAGAGRWAGAVRHVWGSSLGPGLWAAAATVVAMVVAPKSTAAVALVSLTAYSAIDPLLNVVRASWWRGTALTVITWIVLFLVLPALAERATPLREGLMVFLLPSMVFPVAVALSGAIRLAVRRSRRGPTSG